MSKDSKELERRKLYSKKRYEKLGKDGARNLALKWAYGITLEDYKAILKKQNNVCAICNKPETTKNKYGAIKNLSVDHCHLSGHVRGLLCYACNLGIGMLKESTYILRNAIKYLMDDDEKCFNFRD